MKKSVWILSAVILCLGLLASAAWADGMIYMHSGGKKARVLDLNGKTYEEAYLKNGTWWNQKVRRVKKVTTVRGGIEYYKHLKKVHLTNGGSVYFTPDWKYFVGSTWDDRRTKVRHLWKRTH